MSLPQIVVPVPYEFIGSEFQVNTFTSQSQTFPSVSTLEDGGWVVVWVSEGQDGDGTGIYGQRFDNTGVALGAEFQVHSAVAGTQTFPAVASLADGGWVVSWMSSDASGFGIFAQRYDSSGSKLGTEFQVNTNSDGGQINPTVVGLPDGGWLVFWDSDNLIQDGSRQGIYGQRYTSAGNPVGTEIQINTYTLLDQWVPSATVLADGGWVVTWISRDQDGDAYGIYSQRFDASGSPAGSEIQVNTFTSADQWFPSVAALTDGGWVITWGSDGQDGSQFGIYGQRFDASGAELGTEFQVNTTTDADQNFPSVTELADGGWVVTWGTLIQDGSGYGIYGQRYAADGSTVGSEFQINTFTDFDQRFPVVALQPDGAWVVVWESWDQDGSGFGIYGQRMSPFAEVQANDVVEDNTLYATAFLVTDPEGVGDISWQWQRSMDGGGSWTDIAGATTDSYTPDDNDVTYQLRLQGTYQDGLGATKTIYSAGTTPVINVNDAPIAFVVGIGGQVEDGSELTVVASVLADDDGLPAPLNFDFQWQSSSDGNVWNDIGGETNSTFTPAAGDIGKFLRVQASFVDERGTLEIMSSNPTPAVFAEGASLLLTAGVETLAADPISPSVNIIAFDEVAELFLRPVTLDPDSVHYELVAKPIAASDSVAFQIDSGSPLVDFTLSAALSGWTISQNNPDADTVIVSANENSGGAADLLANTEVVLAIFSLAEEGQLDVALSGASVGGRSVSDQALSNDPLQPLGGGEFNGTIPLGSSGLLNGQLFFDNDSFAVGAQDALEALRLAVGLTTTQGTANAFDFIAADFNRDGRVGAQDALEILKYAVALPDALDAGWIFVSAGADLSGVDRNNVLYQAGAEWSGASADTDISLVGILTGDVNDSFVPV